ncbi:hypothetical protein J0871_07570 [Salegentibacter sp. BDJ18]|uniref:hypothetical protein n=1 Tax=Salegentibacter sp. BDJ18 TaxID=2816376 RepID=UPI001AAE6E8A|nr:hypothetical protein [Salegentibacter sp. BDJ18]MBO2544271.1 hypothetical protein [Salegentibacter sp. BDJ18]
MPEKKNIAILTTVANFDLYKKTSVLFPKDISRFVIDGTNGMHSLHSIFYMFKKLKGKEIDWLIMADEDVIFADNSKVFELINYMALNKYSVCGVRDGGMISHRNQNPHSINTFFSILHFSEIEKVFNLKEIKTNHYISAKEFKDDLKHLNFGHAVDSLYEPYYGFYFWLRRKNFKFLFLKAEMPFQEDNITNSVFMPNGDLLLYHTWYARTYGSNKKHTARIDKVLEKTTQQQKNTVDPVIFKDRFFALKEYCKKTIRKIKIKLKN